MGGTCLWGIRPGVGLPLAIFSFWVGAGFVRTDVARKKTMQMVEVGCTDAVK
jgi:hypothetical protein